MGFIILTGVLTILSIIIAVIAYKQDWDNLSFISAIIGVCSGVTFIIILFTLTTLPSDFESYKNEYRTTKMLVDSYKGEEYGNVNALTEKVIKINDRIARHKACSKNFWINVWYSEEVGNFEPIVFK